MKIIDLSGGQQKALLDLCVLGMYADGHLASSEDAGIQKLLTAMGFKTVYDHQVQFDGAVTRVRQHLGSWDKTLACIQALGGSFSTVQERQLVFDSLEDLMLGDEKLSEKESRFLVAIQKSFGL